MGRFRGNIITGNNYEVAVTGPFDARMVVSTKADLIDASTWRITDESLPNIYPGMIVAVAADVTLENNGIYYLTDPLNFESDDAWKKLAQLSDIDTLSERIATLENKESDTDITTNINELKSQLIDSGVLTRELLEQYIADKSFVTSDEVDNKISSAVEGLATEQFVTDKIASAQLGGDVDLSNYVTQFELSASIPTSFYNNRNSFPEIGKENHVYIDVEERTQYIWSNIASIYLPFNTNDDIEIIYGGNAEVD